MRFISLLLINLLVFALCLVAQDNRNLERDKTAGIQTERRIALVIGNGAYTKAKALPNPANDAADMAKILKELGFEVLAGVDLNKRGMESLIRDFGTKLASGGVGLFYYAGHGIQVAGENYLVPVDAEIPNEDEVSYSAVPLGMVLTKMTTAKNDLNIVILDACRNNPFARTWRSYRDAGNSDGLAKISPPTGTLVLYATEPGKVASDGTGRNGLFTASLLRQITRSNLEYDQMVKAVSADVWQRSNKQQLPWKEGNSLQDFYFSVSSAVPTPSDSRPGVPKPTPLPTVTPVSVAINLDAEDIYWNEISRRDTTSGYELYLAEYPKGKHAVEAGSRIDKFKQNELLRLRAEERGKWRETQSLDTKDAYNAYLAAYPKGEFATDARAGIRAVEAGTERIRWLESQRLNTKEAYQSYLSAYPNGEFAADARASISTLESRKEQEKWDEVQVLNRKTAFQSYLAAYPNGRYATAARQKMGEFDAAEAIVQRAAEKAKERAKWDDAERAKTLASYKEYLTAYPTGEFASLARLRLRDLGTIFETPAAAPLASALNSSGPVSPGMIRKNSLGMELVYIPPGEFTMGAVTGEDDERPLHKVRISEGFWIGRYEVSQSQYESVTGTNPSYFRGCGSCPVEQVSWYRAEEFISQLNAKNDGFTYSLPTEAEWEYAASGGAGGPTLGPLNDNAWFNENSGSKTHPIGTKQANAFGLFDMVGNVSEWCADWYEKYPNGAVSDPKGAGALTGQQKVLRGGSWLNSSNYIRLTDRDRHDPSKMYSALGFRITARIK